MSHRPVDRCPIDLGGTPQSTVEGSDAVRALAACLGFSGDAPADYDKFDRRVLERFDVDFRRAGTLVDFDTPLRTRISPTEYTDGCGIRYRFSGRYWEIVDGPLRGAGMDALAAYEFPTIGGASLGLLDDCAARARILFEETPYVVVGEHPVFGVLELACWLCGYDHIMMMLALDPEFIHTLFGRILEFQKSIIREYYGRLGPCIHVTTSGDDFGTQTGPFMSPAMWREFVKPYMKERIAFTRLFTDAVYMHHTCGSVFEIIPDLVEIGVGILNPIQPVAGMDPARLKEAYGGRIVFHGGLDTQEVLPSNDPERIGAAVARLLQAMNPTGTGGYIFAPAHNLQDDVRPSAIACMYDSALRAR